MMGARKMPDAQKHNYEKGQHSHANKRTAYKLGLFQTHRPSVHFEAVAIARHVNPIRRIKISLESCRSLIAVIRPALHRMQNNLLGLR